MKIDRNGIRFLYAEVLAQSWPGLDFAKAPKTQRLPDSLTPNERARILHITRRFDLQCLGFVTDTLGLRLGDTRRLECADIDRERGQVPIRPPKGQQARFVLLPSMTLPVLRKLWCPHRHPRGVFPRRDGASAPGSLGRANGQKSFQQAVADARVLKHVSIHSLRHSDAPPMLEAGLTLSAIEHQRGHACPKTTARYVRRSEKSAGDAQAMLEALVGRFASTLRTLWAEAGSASMPHLDWLSWCATTVCFMATPSHYGGSCSGYCTSHRRRCHPKRLDLCTARTAVLPCEVGRSYQTGRLSRHSDRHYRGVESRHGCLKR